MLNWQDQVKSAVDDAVAQAEKAGKRLTLIATDFRRRAEKGGFVRMFLELDYSTEEDAPELFEE